MRYLIDFKVFESRDSDISELINDEIAPVVNDILLELNFKNIEGECRFVKVGNRKGPNNHYIIIKLKKECSREQIINRDEKRCDLTWDEVSDVIGIASDYLKDNNFINMFNNLDEYLINKGVENSQKWFDEKMEL